MKVRVTQEDIDRARAYIEKYGEGALSNYCPIAQAIKRKQHRPAHVFNISMIVGRLIYRLPGEASKFIKAFDDGRAVEPFEFETL